MPDLSTRKWATDFRRAWHAFGVSVVLVGWSARRFDYTRSRWVTPGATFEAFWGNHRSCFIAYRPDREGD